jgi:hypothetical protein
MMMGRATRKFVEKVYVEVLRFAQDDRVRKRLRNGTKRIGYLLLVGAH